MMYENMSIDYTCHGSLYYGQLQHINNGIKIKSQCSSFHNDIWKILVKKLAWNIPNIW